MKTTDHSLAYAMSAWHAGGTYAKKQSWRHKSSLDTSNLWPRKILKQFIFALKLCANSVKEEPRFSSFCRAEKWWLTSLPSLRQSFHFSAHRWSELFTHTQKKKRESEPHWYLQLLLFETYFPRPSMSWSSASDSFGPVNGAKKMKIWICECSHFKIIVITLRTIMTSKLNIEELWKQANCVVQLLFLFWCHSQWAWPIFSWVSSELVHKLSDCICFNGLNVMPFLAWPREPLKSLSMGQRLWPSLSKCHQHRL